MPASVVWKPIDIGKTALYSVSHFVKGEFMICQRWSICSIFAIQVRQKKKIKPRFLEA